MEAVSYQRLKSLAAARKAKAEAKKAQMEEKGTPVDAAGNPLPMGDPFVQVPLALLRKLTAEAQARPDDEAHVAKTIDELRLGALRSGPKDPSIYLHHLELLLARVSES